MPYVMRNPQGEIVALFKNAEPGSEYLPSDAPEVLAFFGETVEGEGFSLHDDLAMIRVIEDVIELLIAKNLIVLTDLPLAVQKKLLFQQNRRSKLFKELSLDEGGILLP